MRLARARDTTVNAQDIKNMITEKQKKKSIKRNNHKQLSMSLTHYVNNSIYKDNKNMITKKQKKKAIKRNNHMQCH